MHMLFPAPVAMTTRLSYPSRAQEMMSAWGPPEGVIAPDLLQDRERSVHLVLPFSFVAEITKTLKN